MFEISEKRLDDALEARDEIYKDLYQSHPFKTSLKADEVYKTIFNNKDFNSILNLNELHGKARASRSTCSITFLR